LVLVEFEGWKAILLDVSGLEIGLSGLRGFNLNLMKRRDQALDYRAHS